MRSADSSLAGAVASLRQRSFAVQTLAATHPAQRLLDALPDYFAAAERSCVPTTTPQAVLDSGLEVRGLVRLGVDKCVFVVRDGRDLPKALPVRAAWEALFDLALRYVAGIELDTGWSPGVLACLASAGAMLPDAPVETLMRLFCYTPSAAADEVCRLEPHVYRGLLTLVLSNVAGLGVVDAGASPEGWCTPRVRTSWRRTPLLSVLAGKTLQYVSNRRFLSCIHGVAAGTQPRYAVVFQLRPRLDAVIDSARLTTPLTGPFVQPVRESVAEFEERHFKGKRSVNYTE